MEIRVLEYFLAVAREQNITRAAEQLHLTQPTLSRQLADLERELGKQLLIRGKRKVTLTEDGVLLRKRAEEIVGLVEHTVEEMRHTGDALAGDIYLGAGESEAIRRVLHVAKELQADYPDIHFHLTSGDSRDLAERLEKGLFDFCVLYGDIDRTAYEYLTLPYRERWGVLMQRDLPFAADATFPVERLREVPLIVSRQTLPDPLYATLLGIPAAELNVVGSYNLINNAVYMAQEQMGYVLTLEGLVNTAGTDLVFRPVEPAHTLELSLVWKRYQPMSKPAKEFLARMRAAVEAEAGE